MTLYYASRGTLSMKRVGVFARTNWQSALAGALGALAVLAFWASCATLSHWKTPLVWIEQHPGLAAWMQAILSVVAIGASSFFALWVPLHLRDLGERDTVQRAINTLAMMAGTTHSAWDSMRQILQGNAWNGRSGALIRDSIDRAFVMANLVPASMQLGEALTVIARCRSRLVILNELVSKLDATASDRQQLQRTPLAEVLRELEATIQICSQMRPIKLAGSWMIFAPGDTEDHPEIAEAARRAGFNPRR